MSAVYALGVESKSQFVPLYVGQTTNLLRRISEYLNPDFDATTDFTVGKAIERIKENDRIVVFKFKLSESPREEEKRYTQRTEKEITRELLNRWKGRTYDYNKTNPKEVEKQIKTWVKDFLSENPRV